MATSTEGLIALPISYDLINQAKEDYFTRSKGGLCTTCVISLAIMKYCGLDESEFEVSTVGDAVVYRKSGDEEERRQRLRIFELVKGAHKLMSAFDDWVLSRSSQRPRARTIYIRDITADREAAGRL